MTRNDAMRGPAAMMIAVFSLVGCSSSTPGAGSGDNAAVTAEVSQWLDGFWSTWAEGGVAYDRALAMFDDHPDFVFALDGATLNSVGDVDQAYRAFFSTVDHQVFQGPPPRIAVLSPDLVYVSQKGTFTQYLKDGTVTGPIAYAATMDLVRSGSGWKVRFIHQSTPETPTPSWEEGTWGYADQLRGQAINTNGRWIYFYGPADGSGPMTAEAGSYVLAGDTSVNTVAFSTDANRVGQVFRYAVTGTAGDTLTYTVMDANGQVTGQGRAVKVR